MHSPFFPFPALPFPCIPFLFPFSASIRFPPLNPATQSGEWEHYKLPPAGFGGSSHRKHTSTEPRLLTTSLFHVCDRVIVSTLLTAQIRIYSCIDSFRTAVFFVQNCTLKSSVYSRNVMDEDTISFRQKTEEK